MTHSQEVLAQMIRGAYDALGKASEELGDKMTWRPLDKGRSALDQMHECTGFAIMGSKIFAAQKMYDLDFGAMEKMKAEYDTPEKLLPLLRQSAEMFAKEIEAFPSEKMGEKVILPFGPGMEKSFGELALMAYWNAVYHEGQVNYIQTLAG